MLDPLPEPDGSIAMNLPGEDSSSGVSVIVPVSDHTYSLDGLYREFSKPLRILGVTYEFLFVIDAEWSSLSGPLSELKEAGEPIRILETGQFLSESAMVQVGADHSIFPRLLMLPSYPRVVPAALPRLLEGLDRGFDLATAARIDQKDALVNRVQRRTFHYLIRKLVGGRLKDVASGVRAVRREVLDYLDLRGDSFRFIPLLALREGFRVLEVDVEPHREGRKTRVFGPGVYLRRLVDLLGLTFSVRFAYKPLRFFGLIGSLLAGLGAALLGVLFFEKLGGTGIADRPLLLLGVLLFVLGVQSAAMGLIGEIVVHQSASNRRAYRVRTTEDPRSGPGHGAIGGDDPPSPSEGAAG